MHCRQLVPFLLIPSCLGAVGCGIHFPSDDSSSQPPPKQIYLYRGEGRYLPSDGEVRFQGSQPGSGDSAPDLPADERSRYCAVYAQAEPDDATRSKFLSDLDGQWSRDLDGSDFAPFGATFTFSMSGTSASLSGALFQPMEEIDFKRICLSKPIEGGRYAGFRVVELEANNNAGVAFFAARFIDAARGRRNPVLLLTERKYERYGATDPVKPLESVFSASQEHEGSARLWVYPNLDHRPN